MFFCARSMTASRSASFCKFSAVLSLVFSSESPRRCDTESSRSLTVRWSCDWPLASSLMAPSRRAAASACAFVSSAIAASSVGRRITGSPQHDGHRRHGGDGDNDGNNGDNL